MRTSSLSYSDRSVGAGSGPCVRPGAGALPRTEAAPALIPTPELH